MEGGRCCSKPSPAFQTLARNVHRLCTHAGLALVMVSCHYHYQCSGHAILQRCDGSRFPVLRHLWLPQRRLSHLRVRATRSTSCKGTAFRYASCGGGAHAGMRRV